MEDPKAGERQRLWYEVPEGRRMHALKGFRDRRPGAPVTGAREGRANDRKPLDLGAAGT